MAASHEGPYSTTYAATGWVATGFTKEPSEDCFAIPLGDATLPL